MKNSFTNFFYRLNCYNRWVFLLSQYWLWICMCDYWFPFNSTNIIRNGTNNWLRLHYVMITRIWRTWTRKIFFLLFYSRLMTLRFLDKTDDKLIGTINIHSAYQSKLHKYFILNLCGTFCVCCIISLSWLVINSLFFTRSLRKQQLLKIRSE